MARPLKDINWDIVEKMMEYGCTGIAIAGKFRIQKQTFYRRFEEEYGTSFQNYHTEPLEAGKADIRSMLYSKALNNKAPGNADLLKFLARCELGMKEPEEIDNIPPRDEIIEKDNIITELRHEIQELKNGIGAK